MKRVRILFLASIDTGNTNAQSLNAREIALRLDPERIESTLFFEREPDARLRNRPGVHLRRLPRRGKTLRILRELLSSYDVVAYTDCSPATYLYLQLPRRLRGGTRTVFHAEAPGTQIINPSRVSEFLRDGVFPKCDVHTAISDFVAMDVRRSDGCNVAFTLPVGVDTSFFTPPLSRNHNTLTILFVGTVVERKGPQYLLEAAARFAHVKFRIVGAARDGYESVLRERIQECRLSNVILEGPRDQAAVLEIMRQSDVFVLPSRLEGIPKVTLEAAATGLPCIVFRDYETPSVLDGITGFHVSTVGEMLDRLGMLIKDSSLRSTMGKAAVHHAKSFDWNIVSKRWENAYLEIAAASQRSDTLPYPIPVPR